ncbi:MAG TPA: nucleotide pyrophosphohydrolase [Gammaproteobacteria bacterium]|jgi:NTP pyrophosphatase (non-canonical NTP hydrolase)|nr:nucleotide pyrophosphohydrolase [Acidiferrobacteraceae bacterium]MDP6552522.1 nucleotide pyrophosphohydrolase [Arenicellales bacterium]MDP6791701.1 nucleotide pyrophosphohydrolase [Arenicellales bacterium]MDP6918610.1 nucleotide pyrophosphohydrolase [Arenicellales bacterium]HCX87354.1 nucleotide pyrophosphohydrolase [Gammaproteobacteria bacterium]|tara:strand:- start:13302 stop:13655 length:354 start_codon:yes stop_codon:yes gene_type:complete
MSDAFTQALSDAIDDFAQERDWEQFHSPKNLAMALMVEAAELAEHFQWLSERQSGQLAPEHLDAVAEELADVLIYTLRLASRLGLDIEQAAWAKLEKNRQKYPADKARGNAKKYTEL